MTSETQQHTLTKPFIDCYQQLDKNNLDTLAAIYHPDILFQDPICQLSGWPSLQQYFKQLYRGINRCQFVIGHQIVKDNEAVIQWALILDHQRLKNTVTIEGSSLLSFEQNQVIRHRDYYDLGHLVYEQIPLLGPVIQRIKTSLAPDLGGKAHE